MIEFLKSASRGIIDEYRFYFERFLQIFFKIASLSISHFQKNYYDRYGIVLKDYTILVKEEIQTKIVVMLLDSLDISFF